MLLNFREMLMALQFAVVLLMLASAPSTGTTAPPGARLAPAESFSIAAGRVLGAAASCGRISGSRIDRAAQRLGVAIERMTHDPAERSAAHRRLVEGVGQGGSAVELGLLDCGQAEQALAQVERQLQQVSPASSLWIAGPQFSGVSIAAAALVLDSNH